MCVESDTHGTGLFASWARFFTSPDTWSLRKKLLYCGIVLLTASFLLSFRAGQRGLWCSHEGRAGQVAWNMMTQGDYLVPHLSIGQPTYQKPPLFYWSVCWFAWLQGRLDNLAVRLPSIVSAILLALLIFWVGCKSFNPEVGLLSSLILITSADFWWLARVARIDMLLAMLVVSAGFAFYYAYQATSLKWRWGLYLAGYALMGLGVLAKGPVSIVLVACGIILYVLWKRDWAEIRNVSCAWLLLGLAVFCVCVGGNWWISALVLCVCLGAGFWQRLGKPLLTSPHLMGVGVFACVALPWFVLVHYATAGEFTKEFFIYHNLSRFSGRAFSSKPRPIWFYVPHLFASLFPWCLLLPVLFWKSLSKRMAHWDIRMFLLLWSGAAFVFLSTSSFKRADYLVPLMPLLALLLGWLLFHCYQGKNGSAAVRISAILPGLLFALSALSAWAVYLCPVLGHPLSTLLPQLTDLPWIGKKFNALDAHNFTSLIEFLETQRILTLVSFCLILTSGLILIWIRRHSMWFVASGTAALMAASYLAYVTTFLPYQEPVLTQRDFAHEVSRIAGNGRIIIYGTESHDLVFYLGRRIEDFASAYPNQDFTQVVKAEASPSVFFLVRRKDYEKVRHLLPVDIVVRAENIRGHVAAHVLLTRMK
jgi:4-amino-4-deoxy-L-arabinose transferase-like glycosyltransferase